MFCYVFWLSRHPLLHNYFHIYMTGQNSACVSGKAGPIGSRLKGKKIKWAASISTDHLPKRPVSRIESLLHYWLGFPFTDADSYENMESPNSLNSRKEGNLDLNGEGKSEVVVAESWEPTKWVLCFRVVENCTKHCLCTTRSDFAPTNLESSPANKNKNSKVAEFYDPNSSFHLLLDMYCSVDFWAFSFSLPVLFSLFLPQVLLWVQHGKISPSLWVWISEGGGCAQNRIIRLEGGRFKSLTFSTSFVKPKWCHPEFVTTHLRSPHTWILLEHMDGRALFHNYRIRDWNRLE